MTFSYEAIDIAVSRIVKDLSPKKVVLFGSAAKGTAGPESDMDILVIMDTDLSDTQRFIMARKAIGDVGMAADVIVYTPDEVAEFSKDKYSFVNEIMRTGKVVYADA